MTDVLTALVVRLKRRAIRANTKGEVGLASDPLKAVALLAAVAIRINLAEDAGGPKAPRGR